MGFSHPLGGLRLSSGWSIFRCTSMGDKELWGNGFVSREVWRDLVAGAYKRAKSRCTSMVGNELYGNGFVSRKSGR